MKLRRPGWSAVLLVLSLLFGIGLAAANAVLGPLNQDEGLYLQCSRCLCSLTIFHYQLDYRLTYQKMRYYQ